MFQRFDASVVFAWSSVNFPLISGTSLLFLQLSGIFRLYSNPFATTVSLLTLSCFINFSNSVVISLVLAIFPVFMRHSAFPHPSRKQCHKVLLLFLPRQVLHSVRFRCLVVFSHTLHIQTAASAWWCNPRPRWVSRGLLAFPRAPDTRNTPLMQIIFFAVLPSEQPQKGSTQPL